jgi:hypothetical protein
VLPVFTSGEPAETPQVFHLQVKHQARDSRYAIGMLADSLADGPGLIVSSQPDERPGDDRNTEVEVVPAWGTSARGPIVSEVQPVRMQSRKLPLIMLNVFDPLHIQRDAGAVRDHPIGDKLPVSLIVCNFDQLEGWALMKIDEPQALGARIGRLSWSQSETQSLDAGKRTFSEAMSINVTESNHPTLR